MARKSLHDPSVSRYFGIGCRRSRVEPQADQLQLSFNLKPGIEQIDHLLQREPSLFPSRRQLRNGQNQRGVLHNRVTRQSDGNQMVPNRILN